MVATSEALTAYAF